MPAEWFVELVVVKFIAPHGSGEAEQAITREFIGIGVAGDLLLIDIRQLVAHDRQDEYS